MPGSWAGSTRRDTLPPDWPTIQPAILDRDHHRCTWLQGLSDGGPMEYLAGAYSNTDRCTTRATTVDHIGDRHSHQPDNLRALCNHHHDRRSSAQGNSARWQHREKRPTAPHPGLAT